MILIIPPIIVFVSLLILSPAFHIGLYGDDWLAIFRYIIHVAPLQGSWKYWSYFLTPYGSQDMMMGLLYQNFGTQAFYYEITSFILRMIAAFSLYPVVFYLTKNKFASFFAILFFSITTIGLDSTGWLLTMPTYLTIAFFNIFLFFFIKFQDVRKLKLLFLSGLFFYLAYITASARMLGGPLLIITLEIFWLVQNRSRRGIRKFFTEIIFFAAIFALISISGHSLGNSSDWFERLNSGLTTIQKLLSEGRSDFLLFPIVTIGGMIIPNFNLPNIQINTKTDMIFSVTIPILTIFFLFMLFLKSNSDKLKQKDVYRGLIAGIIWILIVFIIRKLNIVNFSSSILILESIIGGLTIIIWILLAIKLHTQKNIFFALFLSFSWTLFSFFLAWIWAPGSYIDSTHRYLTTSAIGISIFLAIIISLGKKLKNQINLALFLGILLVIHILSTRIYIDKLLNSHSQQAVDKIWSSIPHIPDVGKKSLVFYFEGESSNGSILGDSVMFGFPFHTALLYNLSEKDIIPVPMQNWNEVVSAVSDGQSFKPYGYPLKPIPIENVYAFHLQGKDNLVNITEDARQKLIKENNP